jgi:hypothetical protein
MPYLSGTMMFSAHDATLRPGLDLAGFNRLADEVEDEAILASRRFPAA